MLKFIRWLLVLVLLAAFAVSVSTPDYRLYARTMVTATVAARSRRQKERKRERRRRKRERRQARRGRDKKKRVDRAKRERSRRERRSNRRRDESRQLRERQIAQREARRRGKSTTAKSTTARKGDEDRKGAVGNALKTAVSKVSKSKLTTRSFRDTERKITSRDLVDQVSRTTEAQVSTGKAVATSRTGQADGSETALVDTGELERVAPGSTAETVEAKSVQVEADARAERQRKVADRVREAAAKPAVVSSTEVAATSEVGNSEYTNLRGTSSQRAAQGSRVGRGSTSSANTGAAKAVEVPKAVIEVVKAKADVPTQDEVRVAAERTPVVGTTASAEVDKAVKREDPSTSEEAPPTALRVPVSTDADDESHLDNYEAPELPTYTRLLKKRRGRRTREQRTRTYRPQNLVQALYSTGARHTGDPYIQKLLEAGYAPEAINAGIYALSKLDREGGDAGWVYSWEMPEDIGGYSDQIQVKEQYQERRMSRIRSMESRERRESARTRTPAKGYFDPSTKTTDELVKLGISVEGLRGLGVDKDTLDEIQSRRDGTYKAPESKPRSGSESTAPPVSAAVPDPAVLPTPEAVPDPPIGSETPVAGQRVEFSSNVGATEYDPGVLDAAGWGGDPNWQEKAKEAIETRKAEEVARVERERAAAQKLRLRLLSLIHI